MYYRRGSLPYDLPRLHARQSSSMLSAQQLVLYYLYALHDYFCKEVPRHVDGSAIHLSSPTGANGYECFYVYEWCVHQYRNDPFWADTKLPSQRAFSRLLAAYHIGKCDTWGTLRDKIPATGHLHILSVRRHFPGMLDEIRVQLKRYRLNKALVVGTRMKRLNAFKQSQNRPIQGVQL